jgi:Protein of unknown function (DUF3768)
LRGTTLAERDRIRVLNDNFRTTFLGGRVVLTSGVSELPIDTKAKLLLLVKTFDAFTKDNDPYREHDFGYVELGGETFYWKIDYYDRDCQYGSEDPSDPEKTTRVLTIMFAGEY